MGDAIRYPNMGTVKRLLKSMDCHHPISGGSARQENRYVNAGHMWLVNLDSLARYFEQGDPAENSQTVGGIRRVAR